MPASSSDATVLVIDDEPDLRMLYEITLLREGYRVETAATVAEARARLARGAYDAVITDMRLPDGSGLDLLRDLRAAPAPVRCIVITAYGSPENAVEALKSGAFDYLTKPVDLKQFRSVVATAVRPPAVAAPPSAPPGTTGVGEAPSAGAPPAAGQAPRGAPALARLVGDSAAMQAVRDRIARVACSMAPVLVRGESGTGKELVARALHAASHRAAGPMVAVNCGAIPENLLEAEFFGARKGAYTGAMADRDGFFQAAAGGTLFLDEIGDLPLAMQSKLLRALQERSVRPLGATQEEPVDVRIVSATHRDLAADVQSGRFRQDLYYRLNVIEVAVPPLRDRREDLPALCDALLARIAGESGPPPPLSPAARAALDRLPLPGNVRELENLLHRAVALSDGRWLEIDGAAPSPADPVPAAGASAGAPAGPVPPGAAGLPATAPHDLQAYLDAHERDILVRVLRDHRYNRTAAAARLGMSLRQIRYRIARLRIAMPGDDFPQVREAGDDDAGA